MMSPVAALELTISFYYHGNVSLIVPRNLEYDTSCASWEEFADTVLGMLDADKAREEKIQQLLRECLKELKDIRKLLELYIALRYGHKPLMEIEWFKTHKL